MHDSLKWSDPIFHWTVFLTGALLLIVYGQDHILQVITTTHKIGSKHVKLAAYPYLGDKVLNFDCSSTKESFAGSDNHRTRSIIFSDDFACQLHVNSSVNV